jgi:hypothetical protein
MISVSIEPNVKSTVQEMFPGTIFKINSGDIFLKSWDHITCLKSQSRCYVPFTSYLIGNKTFGDLSGIEVVEEAGILKVN